MMVRDTMSSLLSGLSARWTRRLSLTLLLGLSMGTAVLLLAHLMVSLLLALALLLFAACFTAIYLPDEGRACLCLLTEWMQHLPRNEEAGPHAETGATAHPRPAEEVRPQ